MVNSSVSFVYAIGTIGMLLLAILMLTISDGVLVFVASLVLSPFISMIGLLFALIGINEPASFKKWFGFTVNLSFTIFGLWALFESV